MTRQASGFSIFCLIAAIISLIYIGRLPHLAAALRAQPLCHPVQQPVWPALCAAALLFGGGRTGFLFWQPLSAADPSAPGASADHPHLFSADDMPAAFCSCWPVGYPYTLMISLRNPLCFALAGILFGFGTVR